MAENRVITNTPLYRPSSGIGIREQMESPTIKPYQNFSLELLEEVIEDLIKEPVARTFTIHTDEYGAMAFEFAFMGLIYNFRISMAKPVKQGKYRYQVNLFEKHGLYKLYVKLHKPSGKFKFILVKGTEVLGQSRSQYYLLRKLKKLNYEKNYD